MTLDLSNHRALMQDILLGIPQVGISIHALVANHSYATPTGVLDAVEDLIDENKLVISDNCIVSFKERKMSKIMVGGDWCYADQLDGKSLVDGECLDITFPDGFQMRIKVTLQVTGITIGDHGHDYQSTVSEAYYVTDTHGVPARIRLLGFEATRAVF